MKSSSLSKICKSFLLSVEKHSPAILTGVGIGGLLTSTVLAVRATPKAMSKIESEKKKLNKDKLTVTETVKATWKCYIPSAVTSVASVACIIGASSVNLKRNTALATACSLSESAFREYKDKVVETIGEKKAKEVNDGLAKDAVKKNPVSSNVILMTDKGSTLCMERDTGVYFTSDIEKIRKAENELNRQMISDMYVSLNDLYYELGLPYTDHGEEVGWNIDRGFINLEFSSQLSEDGRPCLVMSYGNRPRTGYQRLQ